MKKMTKHSALHVIVLLFTLYSSLFTLQSCIEPPLNLPAEEVMIDVPLVQIDMDIVWNLDIDWDVQWNYGWDNYDLEAWGNIDYPEPTSYEVRRYYLGEKTRQPHTVVDPFTTYGKSFRRTYEFGYYDMLLWSNIDSEDQTQVLVIDESDLDEAHASTSVTRGLSRVATRSEINNFNVVTGIPTDNSQVTGLFNQPEIFYATYPRDIHISRNMEDYDYFDEENKCWVKRINCMLVPRVYIYLVQVIIKNNQSGRIKDASGDCAVSNMSAGTSVNTGHTWNMPVVAYFASRMKHDMNYKGETVDIIGGKFTTFGLCDMQSYENNRDPMYNGSRTDLNNDLYFDIVYNNGAKQTIQVDVTDQMRRQSHGGIITVVLDANDIPDPPSGETGSGSLFVPTVEDYEEIIYDIIM